MLPDPLPCFVLLCYGKEQDVGDKYAAWTEERASGFEGGEMNHK